MPGQICLVDEAGMIFAKDLVTLELRIGVVGCWLIRRGLCLLVFEVGRGIVMK
jgi:hypothetical protein